MIVNDYTDKHDNIDNASNTNDNDKHNSDDSISNNNS